VNVRVIQESLGHGSLRTTQAYAHLTAEVRVAARDPINRLLEGF
jgi:site-specific recombinase XerD